MFRLDDPTCDCIFCLTEKKRAQRAAETPDQRTIREQADLLQTAQSRIRGLEAKTTTQASIILRQRREIDEQEQERAELDDALSAAQRQRGDQAEAIANMHREIDRLTEESSYAKQRAADAERYADATANRNQQLTDEVRQANELVDAQAGTIAGLYKEIDRVITERNRAQADARTYEKSWEHANQVIRAQREQIAAQLRELDEQDASC